MICRCPTNSIVQGPPKCAANFVHVPSPLIHDHFSSIIILIPENKPGTRAPMRMALILPRPGWIISCQCLALRFSRAMVSALLLPLARRVSTVALQWVHPLVAPPALSTYHSAHFIALWGEPDLTPLQEKLNNLAKPITKIGGIVGLTLFTALTVLFFIQLGTRDPAR